MHVLVAMCVFMCVIVRYWLTCYLSSNTVITRQGRIWKWGEKHYYLVNSKQVPHQTLDRSDTNSFRCIACWYKPREPCSWETLAYTHTIILSTISYIYPHIPLSLFLCASRSSSASLGPSTFSIPTGRQVWLTQGGETETETKAEGGRYLDPSFLPTPYSKITMTVSCGDGAHIPFYGNETIVCIVWPVKESIAFVHCGIESVHHSIKPALLPPSPAWLQHVAFHFPIWLACIKCFPWKMDRLVGLLAFDQFHVYPSISLW